MPAQRDPPARLLKARLGAAGAQALLNAFLDAGNDFNVEVLLATRDDDPTDEMILITIGETTAALTREQLRCFADMLLAAPGDCGVAHDFHQFGRLLAQGVAELPHTARTVH